MSARRTAGLHDDRPSGSAEDPLGRKLYDEWSEYWPPKADDPEFGAFRNETPTHVVSDSLTTADWANPTLVRGSEAVERLRQLATATDGDVVKSGSATTVRWLLAAGAPAPRRAPAAHAPDRSRARPTTLRGHADVPAAARRLPVPEKRGCCT